MNNILLMKKNKYKSIDTCIKWNNTPNADIYENTSSINVFICEVHAQIPNLDSHLNELHLSVCKVFHMDFLTERKRTHTT